ncbi:carbohydrate ABC transporter permease [Cohnella rhizosphaerae]|uniref:Carbohydrate ABC transporter permease n=1 Tax=Cohnella rhizosphaerae TaxID=1457232 RepID=A0A9X4KUJ0_9BACL|nr:carbohydrate ABC transporter permease [Cohnella rhizosphaerae]MDG0811290.1 carbohydrate ABC transporter permease [Cohnella rhizosphaerae]
MREKGADRLFLIANAAVLSIVLILVLFPLLHILAASISDPQLVNKGKVWLLPRDLTFEGFRRVFRNEEIWTGYLNTIVYTLAGTLLNLAVTLTCAYPLSRKDLTGRTTVLLLLLFTMFFSGGLIPTYLLVKNLGMLDSIWALIVPGAASVWNILIVRTYFETEIPDEVHEAAMMDGASNLVAFARIALPLAKPIVAVMALFYGVGHWNAYFDALIYLSDRHLYPLQLILREILVQAQMNEAMKQSGGVLEGLAKQAEIAQLLKYAVIIVSTLPVLVAYPFFQRYFVKGIMVGAVKG